MSIELLNPNLQVIVSTKLNGEDSLNRTTITDEKGDSLIIEDKQNYIAVTCVEEPSKIRELSRKLVRIGLPLLPIQSLNPRNNPFYPIRSGSWSSYVGKVPSLSNVVEFGSPTPVARIEFKGHPDQLIDEIMQQQRIDYNPDILVSYVRPDNRSVLTTSPVFNAKVMDHIYIQDSKKSEAIEYFANAMFYIEQKNVQKGEVSKKSTKNTTSLRVGLALMAQNDGLLRIKNGNWYSITPLKGEQKEFFFDYFAHMALDWQTLQSKPLTVIEESVLLDIDAELQKAYEIVAPSKSARKKGKILRKLAGV